MHAHPTDRGYRFLTDASASGLLHAAVLRSPHPHARIVSVDTSQARSMPGVVAVVTAADVPGTSRFGIAVLDQPILCADRVRTIGDPVAAIAADTPANARAAARAIRVAWEQLPVVASAADALAPGAPSIHEGGNLLHRTSFTAGDLAATHAAAAHVVEDTYETPRQVHGFIEPEGAVALPSDDGLVVMGPAHWAEAQRNAIAGFLAIDPARLRVVASPAGGSYGGKDQFHAQPIAALLAHVTGRPVRLIWRRPESFAIGVKRHPFVIRMRSSCDSAGRLLGHEVSLLADTGAYGQHGPEVLDTAHENAQGPYRWQAVSIEGRLAYTNNGVAGAMRGFGAVQVQIALEQQIDRLAAVCGIDPLTFRRMNLRDDRASGQLGQTLAAPSWPSRALARLRMPPAPRRIGRYLEGSGVALVEKGEGFAKGGPNHGSIVLALADDGAIEVRCGLSDLGQGIGAAAAAGAARMLGCAPEDVRARFADTSVTPDTGPIAASRGAGVLWRALLDAAPAFAQALRARAAAQCGEVEADLVLGRGGIYRRDTRQNRPLVPLRDLAGSSLMVTGVASPLETSTGSGAAHAVFTSCAAEATVAIDTVTGRLIVRSIRLVPVSGPVLSADAVRAQMEGGASLAAGLVTCESLPAASGRFRAQNLDGYLVPTIRDAFPIKVEAVDDIPADVLGARGVGEMGVNATAPAIANAIHAASGFVCRRLPVDPAEMLAHLEARR